MITSLFVSTTVIMAFLFGLATGATLIIGGLANSRTPNDKED
jgi:hypothetical protein